ncbi:hypothetical protein LCGC14_0359050 [marine sediment metagenome]|uniref:Uncharacterized protein n=1 Tax=marine sediment metagenome TaxID=412755 RepID=A0A0F9TEH5_9ZZZZ
MSGDPEYSGIDVVSYSNCIDSEDYHCGKCGKYVSEADGFYGAAERADGEPQKIYCDDVCCKAAEPDIVL